MIDKQKHCAGCDRNFYNGNNPLGVKECWRLKDAKLVTRYSIGWWTPQTKKEHFTKVKVLSCFTQAGRRAFYEKLPSHLT